MAAIKGKAVVAQSGGPTAVINASAYGVVQTAQKHPEAFTAVYGALNGILGVLNEELFDFAREDAKEIDRLWRTPSAALGSCRHKLKSLEKDRTDYQRILDVFKAHDIRYFFYIGGNDSMDTAARLGKLALEEKYEMIAIGVPKTIDNDLAFTDHCPGYGSVAKYTATSVMEAGLDTAALYTHDTCTVHEVMGRNAGWIAASAGLARRKPHDAPHIILVPEVPFVLDRFIANVKEYLKLYKQCFIACGEGIKTADGKYLGEAGGAFAKDSFGHAQLGGAGDVIRAIVEKEAGVKCRVNRAGTAQRVAMHFASQTDVKEAVMVGQAAISAALHGVHGKMITLVREAGPKYRCSTGLVELEKAANGEKPLPPEFIGPDGASVTEAFKRYLSPLVAGAADVETGEDGLPVYTRLVRKLVTKQIGR
ncbi:MAG: 6-phosphofructokinase [Planctomycetes bacterium]|nr:6-phosphofructokinase [Planctomycetota bacterium]